MQFDPETTKRILRIIFFIMLMDIVGMSIIFPVIPPRCTKLALSDGSHHIVRSLSAISTCESQNESISRTYHFKNHK
jgi:hypothetical protein